MRKTIDCVSICGIDLFEFPTKYGNLKMAIDRRIPFPNSEILPARKETIKLFLRHHTIITYDLKVALKIVKRLCISEWQVSILNELVY